MATSDRAGHFVLAAELANPYLGTDIREEARETHVGTPDPLSPGAWRVRLVIVLETWQLDGFVEDALKLRSNRPRGFY
ncbi:MAG TPA: hypothetical protein VLM11_08540 [Streptosporangiaceae bacterium]|nr:hypothetical protein [Streptosporangiaceae bacterium]